MKMRYKSAEEHNRLLNNLKRKPDQMSSIEWNKHLDELKRTGKYDGQIYVRTRSRLDEIFEINEDINAFNRGE